jgi:hypothetical protein
VDGKVLFPGDVEKSSIDESACDVAVGIDAAVAEKWPVTASFFQPAQVTGHD